MTTLNNIVDEVLLNLSSYGLYQPRLTTLAVDVGVNDTAITVMSAANIPVGLVEVGDELMYVQSVDTSANALTVIRGFRSTATTHTTGDLVTVNPPWPRVQVVRAINDAIASSYPVLFKVSTTELTASGSANTYDLADAGRVLQVRNLAVGPTQEWLKVNRYRYDADLGKLTVYEGMVPGSAFHVVHTSTPTALANGTDDLTTSGLQASAKPYVVLAATAQMVLPMDGSRLPVNSAQSDDMEQNRTVGSAANIAKVLISRAEMELDRERKRLTQKYPVTISFARSGR